MMEKTYGTSGGMIHYYVNQKPQTDLTLVFLPGLTADHRLFDRQVEAFEGIYNLFTWDAPGHAASRPFLLDFKLQDKARWLKEILEAEGIDKPVLVGQSMGGYVGQMFEELFPGVLQGFISIDSAPLQRQYVTGAEIWLLKHTESMYRYYPWKRLIKDGAKGVATTPYGRELMARMMQDYEHKEYARLAAHGYRMLADAMEADLAYEITCPILLICGEEDKAGSTKNYNKCWHEKTGIPIVWIKNAGHNSNTDQPEEINRLILEFLTNLKTQ